MKRVIKLILYIFVSWICIHSLIITIDGLTDNFKPSDVVVVLGSKVNENGQASERLKARLDIVKTLFDNGTVKNIVVSGGFGKEGYDEATIMYDYLISRNIPDSVIIIDSKGNNTYLTASNFIKLNKKYKFKTVVLVSQFFHLSRTKLIFKKLGIKNVTTAHAKYFEWRDIYSLFREFPAYYNYLIY